MHPHLPETSSSSVTRTRTYADDLDSLIHVLARALGVRTDPHTSPGARPDQHPPRRGVAGVPQGRARRRPPRSGPVRLSRLPQGRPGRPVVLRPLPRRDRHRTSREGRASALLAHERLEVIRRMDARGIPRNEIRADARRVRADLAQGAEGGGGMRTLSPPHLEQGACRDEDPERSPWRPRSRPHGPLPELRPAKAVCHRCPVRCGTYSGVRHRTGARRGAA